jgi:drug/metabolite transporter (DMT)-like permease
VTGALWAAASGVGFGVFQVLNARAIRDASSVYLATFVQLVVATAVFAGIVAGNGRLHRIADIPAAGLGWFAAAGMLHFFLGWTTLNQSQARIGAARTAPLLATSPVFGVAFALVYPGSVPGAVALAGIAVTVLGAYLVTAPGGAGVAALRDAWQGVATSAAWALSAVFTAAGLRVLDDALLGVTVGMGAAALAYGAVLVAVPRTRGGRLPHGAWGLKVLAGVVVALATWWRWLGLADAAVGVVLALQLLTVPTVLALVALRSGRDRLTARVWWGSGLVLSGVALLLARP